MTGQDTALRSGLGSSGASRYGRWLALAALALALVLGIEAYLSRDEAAPTPWALRSPGYGPATYADALAASDARVADKRALLRAFPHDWVRGEALARAYRERYRLSGNYEDFALAGEAMARARAQAPYPGGPVLADAELAMAGHRLADAEATLAVMQRWAVPPDRAERAEAEALAGDIAFYRGDIAEARRGYARAQALDPGASALRIALADKARGQFEDAIAGLRRALDAQKSPTPFTVATIALQIGAIEQARGDYAEGRRRFDEAQAVFPGYWLTEAHLAQTDAVAGKPKQAIARMRRVAESSQSAEAMDALAMLLRTYGQPAESRAWAQRAGALWSRRLALLPEAAYGHAVEHELVFGTPARALNLAQRNLAARPFGESRLLLAAALLQNGRIAEALGELARAEASGWRSAPLHALRAEALTLAGRPQEAERSRAAAEALNPRIFDPETALIWFSHG